MDFFVGMSYVTMLPTNAVATVASQVAIHATATDSATFAMTTEQDYTFIEYITMSLYQTKFVEDSLIEHYLQFVKVGFVLPESLTQNMQTGLVPLNSIRFAIARTTPAADDLQAWQNPCFSSDGSGLFDDSSSALNVLYTEASFQSCALQPNFCQNPLSPVLASGLVDFWFPIGDELIDSTILNSEDEYSIFVYFDVSVVLANGKKSLTKLFSQAKLSDLAIARSCETLSAAQTIADITDVDLDIGIVGLESDWDTSMTSFTNLVQTTEDDNFLDTSLIVQAPSAASALITIVLHGNDDAFTNPVASNFRMEIDDMITVHFLENTKYQEMVALINAGTAYELVREEQTGYLDIVLTAEGTNVCASANIAGDFTCVVRKDINRRQITQEYAMHSMGGGGVAFDESVTSEWLQEHVLGVSEFGDELARNFTRLSRSKHAINDRYNRAWFVNPMYKWSVESSSGPQAILALSEKTIIFAVISLEDGNFQYGNVGQRRRFLLQVTQENDQVSRTIKALDSDFTKGQMPPIFNKNVKPMHTAAQLLSKANEQHAWASLHANVEMTVPAGKDAAWVRSTIQSRLRKNLPKVSENIDEIDVVQFLMQPKTTAGRRLLQDQEVVEWDGFISMIISQNNVDSEGMYVWYNWMRCALYEGNLTSDRYGDVIPDCGFDHQGDFWRDTISSVW